MPLLNNDLKHRYYHQVKSLYSKDGFIKYFKESQYGAHQATAFKIFTKNILVGIGVKILGLRAIKIFIKMMNIKKLNIGKRHTLIKFMLSYYLKLDCLVIYLF